METSNPVVIIGAGVAGLTCAHYLHRAGIPCQVLEAADAVGGRVRTDVVEGYRLDRGFQIFLTAYPEAQRLLDYPALGLGAFRSGAVIRMDNDFVEMADPRREPSTIGKTLTAPVGSFLDKLRVMKLVWDVSKVPAADDFFRAGDQSTYTYLRDYGWDDRMIRTFFRPFFGGVFLEDKLITSSNFFRFVFRQFYEGEATLPSGGMQAIPEQIAAGLPAGTVRLNTRVSSLEGSTLRLESGEVITAGHIVVAADGRSADQLLGQVSERAYNSTKRAYNSTTCTYFAADRSPLARKMLILNPDRNAAVQHIAILSDIAPAYAPPGKTLISVTSRGTDGEEVPGLEEIIRQELRDWFGDEVLQWRFLRRYHVPEALVRYGEGSTPETLRLNTGLYRCGDYTAYPSLNAAMQTGREVAEMISAEERSVSG